MKAKMPLTLRVIAPRVNRYMTPKQLVPKISSLPDRDGLAMLYFTHDKSIRRCFVTFKLSSPMLMALSRFKIPMRFKIGIPRALFVENWLDKINWRTKERLQIEIDGNIYTPSQLLKKVKESQKQKSILENINLYKEPSIQDATKATNKAKEGV